MKEVKNIAIHDPVREIYDATYEIFKSCGGISSLPKFVLEALIIVFPIAFVILDYFQHKFSLIILFTIPILIYVYYRITDSQISKYYIEKLKIKPSKTNLYEAFYCKCSENNISYKDINYLCEYIDTDRALSHLNDFSTPLLLTLLLSIITNRIEELIKLVEEEQPSNLYAYIIPLIVWFYLVIWVITTSKSRNQLLFKKALVYAKIRYSMQNPQS